MRHVSGVVIAVAALLGSVMWADAQDPGQGQIQKQGKGAGEKVQRTAPQERSQAPVRTNDSGKSDSVGRSRPERSEAPKVRRETVDRAPREAVDRAPRKVERKAQGGVPDEAGRARKSEAKKTAEPKQSGEPRRTGEAKEPRTTDSKARVDSDKRIDEKRAAQSRQSKDAKTSSARLQVSEQHRVRLRESLSRERARRISKASFAASVGARVPRSVRLYAFPATYIAYAPEYRSYRYVLVEDRICIVDPDSYEVVAIIDDEPGRGQYAARFSLTAEEREFIRANAPRERARASARISLALGAEIPRSVELVRFPGEVVRVVPKVQSYRYIVVQEDIVIVDPSTREVMLVIKD